MKVDPDIEEENARLRLRLKAADDLIHVFQPLLLTICAFRKEEKFTTAVAEYEKATELWPIHEWSNK